MAALLQDLRYAARLLWKTRGFTALVALTIALGVGANTAVFAVVHAALLRSLPYPDAAALVTAGDQSPGLFLEWQRSAGSFSAMSALRDATFDITGAGRPERIPGAIVTAGFFDVMQVRPAIGRPLTYEDDRSGARVVVVADRYWKRRFGADPRALGSSIVMNGQAYTIVGIMPPGFEFPEETQAWTPPRHVVPEHPLTPDRDATQMFGSHYLGVYARLKPGVTLQAAQAEQRVIFTQLRQRHPDDVLKEDVEFTIVPLREWLVGDIASPLLILMVAVGLVLLIGCANVANLLLAKSMVRRQEISVRAALGAGRGRIARQLLTESVLLGAIGGTAGTVAAVWALPVLIALSPASVREVHAEVSWPILAFALAVSLGTGVLFGCAPALQGTRLNLADDLRSAGRSTASREGRRVRRVLVVAEFALSLALLAGAGLMIRSFLALRSVDPGFRAAGLQTVRLDVPVARYATRAQQAQFFDRLLERVRSIPGVSRAAAAGRLPFAGGNSTRGITIGGSSATDAWGGIRVISPGYLEVMGIPLVEGRSFTERDREGAPMVALVNQAMARKYWPGRSPVGQRFHLGADGPWIEIVGIVANTKHGSLREPIDPEFYQPYGQAPWTFMTVVIETGLGPQQLTSALDRELSSIDSAVAMPPVRPMSDLVAGSVSIDRFEMVGLVTFAALALLLAAIGLYGVMAYLVGQRTREIGLRIALGASSKAVVGSIMSDGLALVAIGLVAGFALTLAVTRVLREFLFGVSPTDPSTLAVVAAVLVGVAVLACLIPARRAMRIDPMVAIRE
jgi:putative ABC transport system permease protein